MSVPERLKDMLGSAAVVDATDWSRYCEEPRGRFHGDPLAVVRPASTEELARAVRLLADEKIAMVPHGGRTGLVGGSNAARGQVVISLERMRQVRSVDVTDASVEVEAGCSLGALRRAVADQGLMYPVSLASEDSATIGGTIATNAGGNLTIRYGNTRRQILGLEAVLADGRIYRELAPLRKDNSGYDLKQLLIGSEGTLGIITAATLALQTAARQSVTALVALPGLNAGLALLARLQSELGEVLSACEFMPRQALEFVLEHLDSARDPFAGVHAWYVLVQLDSAVAGQWLEAAVEATLESAMEDGLVVDVAVAASAAQARSLWQLRESISAAQKRGGASLKHDISVPIASIPTFIKAATDALEQAVPGIRPCIFGHLGDGNLHFNLSQPETMDTDEFQATEARCNRIVFDLVRHFNGSIAAEHGVGLLRREELAAGQPLKVELMRRVKRALDPDNLLNPGKVV